jgi:double-strand break repair protein MRE11
MGALQVDFVLLGGDLFHDNKPSRTTLVRAMDILTKYCLNGNAVPFHVISNQSENFVSG